MPRFDFDFELNVITALYVIFTLRSSDVVAFLSPNLRPLKITINIFKGIKKSLKLCYFNII